MSEPTFEPEVPVSSYGAQRRADWLAGLQRNADAMTAASMAAHGADHRAVTAASNQAGIFGPGATGYDQAAEVARRAPTVGSGTDAGGRPLEAWGGYDFEGQGAGAVAPIPPRADLRYVNQVVRPTGESPLVAYMKNQGQR